MEQGCAEEVCPSVLAAGDGDHGQQSPAAGETAAWGVGLVDVDGGGPAFDEVREELCPTAGGGHFDAHEAIVPAASHGGVDVRRSAGDGDQPREAVSSSKQQEIGVADYMASVGVADVGWLVHDGDGWGTGCCGVLVGDAQSTLRRW